jgi:hypothetical protein
MNFVLLSNICLKAQELVLTHVISNYHDLFAKAWTYAVL